MVDIFTVVFLVGRVILGVYYIFNAINHFSNFKMLSGYAQSKGVPASGFFVAVTGLLLLFGGLSILTGVQPLIGIALLLTFLLPTTFVMHNFWAVEDPQMRMMEMVNFTKNLALIGSLLMFLGIPVPWEFSLL
jgi:uncharacterized membrane protein YphA (DoxX/SURF4 family)